MKDTVILYYNVVRDLNWFCADQMEEGLTLDDLGLVIDLLDALKLHVLLSGAAQGVPLYPRQVRKLSARLSPFFQQFGQVLPPELLSGLQELLSVLSISCPDIATNDKADTTINPREKA